jgi:hypothetical protein
MDARRDWPDIAKKIVGSAIKRKQEKVEHADIKKEASLRVKEVVKFVRDGLKNELGGAIYYKIDERGVCSLLPLPSLTNNSASAAS